MPISASSHCRIQVCHSHLLGNRNRHSNSLCSLVVTYRFTVTQESLGITVYRNLLYTENRPNRTVGQGSAWQSCIFMSSSHCTPSREALKLNFSGQINTASFLSLPSLTLDCIQSCIFFFLEIIFAIWNFCS